MLKALLLGLGSSSSSSSSSSTTQQRARRFLEAKDDGGDRPLLCSGANDDEEEEEGDLELKEGTSSWTEWGNSNMETSTAAESNIAAGGSIAVTNSGKGSTKERLKYQPDSFTHRRMSSGLGWITAALFIIADMAGGGVVAIPMALLKSGLLVGSLSMALIGTAFCYTAHLLGENWLTMCRRWPHEYGREHCRKPYPEMAYRAMGERARIFMSCTLNVTLFGVSVVYLLLAAKIISELWASLSPAHSVGPCVMTVLLSVALLPITFLKSPQDFWWAIVTAMLTTTLSVALILLGTLLDMPLCGPAAQQPPFRPGDYALCIGIFFFSFGGHGVFPTIQHDMRRPRKFTRSSVVAFIAVASMYVPISFLGYFVYGDSLHESIISSLQIGIIQQLANFLIALHCVLTLTIVINPLNQEIEHVLDVPHHFCWQRMLVRSGVMLCVVFMALTVPSFGPILNLIGGTSVALTSAILPCLFHLFLHAADETASLSPKQGGLDKDKALISAIEQVPTFFEVIKRTPRRTLILNVAVIAIAVLCGAAATNSALIELSSSKFSRPCYLASAAVDSATAINRPAVQAMHCCGTGRNISRYEDFKCPLYKSSSTI